MLLEEEELPKESSVEYMLAPPSEIDDSEEMVIFCVDISGSMCVSTEVPALQSEWKNLRKGEINSYFLKVLQHSS